MALTGNTSRLNFSFKGLFSSAKGSDPFQSTHLVIIQPLMNILQFKYDSYSQDLSLKLFF
jgi:hypothetical protein